MLIQQEIEQLLTAQYSPVLLDVVNESNQHNVPANSETHFKVVIVSDNFAGVRKVARHQMIYAVLAEQLKGPVHALAIHCYSVDEWQQDGPNVPLSPKCLGGSKGESL
jgi:BolA protein